MDDEKMMEKLRGKIRKEGYMFKAPMSKGKDVFRKGWENRYFVLKGKTLFYYEKRGELKHKGKMELGESIVRLADDVTRDEFSFKISEARQHHLYLKAPSQSELDDWVQLIVACGATLQQKDGTIAARLEANIVVDHDEDQKEVPDYQLAVRTCWGAMFKDSHDDLHHDRVVLIVDTDQLVLHLTKDAVLQKTLKIKNMDNIVHATKADDRLPSGKKLIPVTLEVLKGSKSLRSYKFNMGTAKDAKEVADTLFKVFEDNLQSIILRTNFPPIHSGFIEIRIGDATNRWQTVWSILDTAKLLIFQDYESRYPLFVFSLEQAVYNKDDKFVIEIDGPLTDYAIRLKKSKSADKWMDSLRLAQKSYDERVNEQFSMDGKVPDIEVAIQEDELLKVIGISHLLTGDSFVAIWGCGKDGQLGDRGKNDSILPSPLEFFDRKSVRWVAASKWSPLAFATTSDGTIYGWGIGLAGELGNGETRPRINVPATLSTLKSHRIVRVAVGRAHALALSAGGEVFSWGEGSKGQLGHNLRENYFHPKKIDELSGNACRGVFAGGDHSAVIVGDRKQLYVFGSNSHGQLGVGDRTDRLIPGRNLLAPAVKGVALGSDFSAAVTEEGAVYTWGSGEHGKLGHKDEEDLAIPKKIDFFEKKEVSIAMVDCGDSHMLALTEDGYVYAWGAGDTNGLKKGKDKLSPGRIKWLSEISFIAAGKERSFFITEGGRMIAYGPSPHGELGLGRIVEGCEFAQTVLKEDLDVVHVSPGADFTITLIRDNPPGLKLTDTSINVLYGEEEEEQPNENDEQKISIGALLDIVETGVKMVKVDAKGWKEKQDEATGKIYYYNKETKETKWAKDMDPLLIEAIQKEAKRKAEAKAMASAVNDIPAEPSASKTASSGAAKTQTASNSTAAEEKPLPPNWKAATDPGSGKTYFYNKKSKETRWTRPEE